MGKFDVSQLLTGLRFSRPFNKGSEVFGLLIVLVCLLVPTLVACGDTTSTAGSGNSATTAAAGTTAAATTSTSTTAAANSTTSGAMTTAASGAATTTATNATTSGAGTTSNRPVAAVTPLSSTPAGVAAGGATGANPTGNLETDIRNVVDTVKPAVVLIAVSTPQAQGVGTGSIITPDGYIVTNFHVVAAESASVSPQTKIQVVMTDGKKYPANVVGTDRSNDLAVVKIEATGLPVIKQGSSSALHVGDWVVAVGNALGLPGGPTVTTGIVSAIGRSIQEPAPASANLTDLIQTSAAINPGNSGGPLLNLNGELVGVNTAAPVDPQSGAAAQGIGFAISIDQAKPIIQTLMSGKSIVPPYMGILPETLTPGLAAQFQLPTDTGVLIRQVGPGTPAAQAGWKAGDTITQMDGTKLSSIADLQGVLNKHKPGDTVSATLVTPQGQTQQTNITFGQPPAQ
jgi:S1-C subfamily serine protease